MSEFHTPTPQDPPPGDGGCGSGVLSIENHTHTTTPTHADLIEAILCEYDWCISRKEAETLADKLMRETKPPPGSSGRLRKDGGEG